MVFGGERSVVHADVAGVGFLDEAVLFLLVLVELFAECLETLGCLLPPEVGIRFGIGCFCELSGTRGHFGMLEHQVVRTIDQLGRLVEGIGEVATGLFGLEVLCQLVTQLTDEIDDGVDGAGSLFQGRFKAVLVEDESHALELTRYIHLNPVRAMVVERPEAWPWSSYPDYLGMRKSPAWLDGETVLAEMAKSPSRARSAYRRFVEAGLHEPPSSPFKGAVAGMFLGSQEWVEQWRRRIAAEPVRPGVPAQQKLAWRPGVQDVVAAVSRAFGVEARDLCVSRRHGNEARSAAIYLARRLTDEKVGTIGSQFGGVSPPAISKTVARVEARRATDRALDRCLTRLSKQLQTKRL